MTTKARLYEDDTTDRWLHIYYNPSKQSAEREQRSRKRRYRQFLDTHIGQDTKFGKTYQDYFYLYYDKHGRFIGVEDVLMSSKESFSYAGTSASLLQRK